MLPINCGSHSDYQNFVVTNLYKYYPNPDALAKSTWDIIERFWKKPYTKGAHSVSNQLINPDLLDSDGDGTPFVTSAMKRKHRVCDCSSKGINDCSCVRYFSQPDLATSDVIHPVPFLSWILFIYVSSF